MKCENNVVAAKGAETFARRAPVREPYDVVLIVCEGEKTEPLYFLSIRKKYRLSSANIHIIHPSGTDPMTIVTFAEGELKKGVYDRVYCVFDRDGHSNYHNAVAKIINSVEEKSGRLIGTTSWPCFEFWLLLHFVYVSAPIQKSGTESACDKVLRELKQYIPSYAKGEKTTFDQLEQKLNYAMRNARRLSKENFNSGSTNPATRVHELVGYLLQLKHE